MSTLYHTVMKYPFAHISILLLTSVALTSHCQKIDSENPLKIQNRTNNREDRLALFVVCLLDRSHQLSSFVGESCPASTKVLGFAQEVQSSKSDDNRGAKIPRVQRSKKNPKDPSRGAKIRFQISSTTDCSSIL